MARLWGRRQVARRRLRLDHRERKLVCDLTQSGRGRIAMRRLEILDWQWPLDADVRIVVGNSALCGVRVVVALLIHHVRYVSEHAETVSKPDRAIRHSQVFVS